jgi:protein-S-isoprenylcysteine O-methyltransferase Ste14
VKLGLFLLVGYFVYFSFALIWLGNRITLMSVTAGVLLVGVWLVVGILLMFRPSIDREARRKLERFMHAAIS